MPKKKKSSAKKTSKSVKKFSLEDVLSQAETAMEMANIETALTLFEYASSELRKRVHGGGAAELESDKKMLTTVQGKLGELKASMGDIEGARTEFLDAVELLGHSPQMLEGNTDESMDAMEGTDVNLSTAQHCEHVASLYLYLGQLSSGSEALTSFKTGVHELSKAVAIFDRRCNSIKFDETSNEMDVDGEDMSLDELTRYLDDTRYVHNLDNHMCIFNMIDQLTVFNSTGDSCARLIVQLLNYTSQTCVMNLALKPTAKRSSNLH